MLEEINARLKKNKLNEDELWSINSLYLLLDLSKDDFCKIIDCVGLDVFLKKEKHFDRLINAEEELRIKENCLNAKRRLEEMEQEKISLIQSIELYEKLK